MYIQLQERETCEESNIDDREKLEGVSYKQVCLLVLKTIHKEEI